MAVISVCELWRGRTGSWGEEARRSYVRIFRVKTDTQYSGPLRVLTEGQAFGPTPVPLLGSAYADADGVVVDQGARCKSLTPNATDDPWTWEVACEYDSETRDEDEQTQPGEDDGGENPEEPESPLDREVEISFTFERGTKLLIKDLATGAAVVNSANDAFDPPIEIPASNPVITFVRNEWPPPYGNALDYQDAVNSDTIQIGNLIVSSGKARMRNISIGPKQEQNGFPFVKVTYEVELNKREWDPLQVLDQGFNELNPDKNLIVDSNGDPVSTPWPLDGNGGALSGSQAPVFLDFTAYENVAFQPLGLFE